MDFALGSKPQISQVADAVNYLLANIGSNSYTLPVATTTVLGGVKQGSGVTIAVDGTISATGGTNTVNNTYQFSIDGIDGEDAIQIPGPRGLTGIAGTAGVNGINGIDGEDGQDGMTIPGPAGANGATGPQGLQGPTGPAIYLEADYQEADMFLIPGPTGPQGPAGGGGGGGSWTEGEVDFGSTPVKDVVFTITDAAITATSKVIIMESGKLATGRIALGDGAWDSINLVSNPGTGSAQVWAIANPGPVVGKRKYQYTVA